MNDIAPQDLTKGAGKLFNLHPQRILLPGASVREFDTAGESLVGLSLRHNFPIGTPLLYKHGSNTSAVVISKANKLGKWWYLLRSECWKPSKKVLPIQPSDNTKFSGEGGNN